LITAFAGFTLIIAIWLLTESTAHGKAGPALALIQIQSVVNIALEMTILGTMPSTPEWIGFFLGLLGAVVISLAKK